MVCQYRDNSLTEMPLRDGKSAFNRLYGWPRLQRAVQTHRRRMENK